MVGFTNLILLLQPEKKDIDNESYLDNTPSYSIKRVHDIRMVWPPETPGDEDLVKLAAHRRDPVFMGSGVLRILCAGAGKPHRLHRQRRSVQPHAAQGDPGGDFAYSIHSCCYGHVQGTEPSVEPYSGFLLPHHGCFLRILEVKNWRI